MHANSGVLNVSLQDQLDGAPAMASQIGDGSRERKAIALATAVADF